MRRTHVLFLLSLGIFMSQPAAAGVRVWEKNLSGGDAPDPDMQMYFEIGGFLQPGLVYRQDDPLTQQYSDFTESGFYLQRARINARFQLTKYFLAVVEVETLQVPQLTDAYIESRIRPWFTIRAGQFLVPFLQTFQFAEQYTGFIDRELYVPQDYNRTFLSYLAARDIGIQFRGLVGDISPSSRKPVFEYQVAVVNGNGPDVPSNPKNSFEVTGRVQLHTMGVPEGREAETDVVRNKTPHLAIGAGFQTNCTDVLNWERGFTADAEFRYQGIYASASFVWFHNGPGVGPGTGIAQLLGYSHYCVGGQVPENIASGAHVQGQYVLPERVFHALGGAIEVLARWDYVNPFAAPDGFLGSTSPTAKGFVAPTSYDSADNAPSRWRVTLGVNWYPTNRLPMLHLSLNYQYVQQIEGLPEGDTTVYLHPSLLWLEFTAGI